MSIAIAISCGALPAVGALMALQERDVMPALTIARGGSALAVGLSACGWNAVELQRLAHMLKRNRLALLAQVLPSLTDRATMLSPRELAELMLGGSSLTDDVPYIAKSDDPIETLLWELTRGVELRDLSTPIAMPVRAFRRHSGRLIAESEPRLLTSGRNAHYAVTLATALRCAAFDPILAGAPTVGGALLAPWRDGYGDTVALRRLDSAIPLISICPANDLEHRRSMPENAGMTISIPKTNRHADIRAAIESGYISVREHIDQILSFC